MIKSLCQDGAGEVGVQEAMTQVVDIINVPAFGTTVRTWNT